MDGDRKESESILISSSDYKDMMPSTDFSTDSKDQEAEDRLRIARDLKAGLHPLRVFSFFPLPQFLVIFEFSSIPDNFTFVIVFFFPIFFFCFFGIYVSHGSFFRRYLQVLGFMILEELEISEKSFLGIKSFLLLLQRKTYFSIELSKQSGL